MDFVKSTKRVSFNKIALRVGLLATIMRGKDPELSAHHSSLIPLVHTSCFPCLDLLDFLTIISKFLQWSSKLVILVGFFLSIFGRMLSPGNKKNILCMRPHWLTRVSPWLGLLWVLVTIKKLKLHFPTLMPRLDDLIRWLLTTCFHCVTNPRFNVEIF